MVLKYHSDVQSQFQQTLLLPLSCIILFFALVWVDFAMSCGPVTEVSAPAPPPPSTTTPLTLTGLLCEGPPVDITTIASQLINMLGGNMYSAGGQKRRRREVLLPPPRSRDWRQVANALGPVKNQGQCDVSWAFAAIAAMESSVGIKYGQYISLSEQELIDCANPGVGCPTQGSFYSPSLSIDQAYSFLKNDMAGIAATSTYGSYTYQSGQSIFCPTEQCQSLTAQPAVKLTDYQVVNGEIEIQSIVGNDGPVATVIMVSPDLAEFGFSSPKLIYRGCTSPNPLQYCTDVGQACLCSDPKCPTGAHAVLVVGYDTNADSVDYWILRNSWGPNWGDGGYFYLARNVNMCGIGLSYAYYPDTIVA